MRFAFPYPSGLNAGQPVEWDHPLNAGRLAWWLVRAGGHPSYFGGPKLFDLCKLRSGGPRDGVLNGPPLWGSGPLAGGVTFPGGWGAMTFTVSSANYLNCGTGGWAGLTNAVTLWLRVQYINSTNDRLHFGRGYDGSNAPFVIANISETGGNIGFGFYDGSWHTAADPAAMNTSGRVYDVVGTYDRANLRLYLDGVQVASTAETAALPAGTGSLVFGNMPGWISSQGMRVAGGSVWNRALTASQVAQHCDLARRGFPGALRRQSSLAYFLPLGAAPTAKPSVYYQMMRAGQ